MVVGNKYPTYAAMIDSTLGNTGPRDLPAPAPAPVPSYSPPGASGYTPGLYSWEQTAQRRKEMGNYLGGPGGWTPQAIGMAAGTLSNTGAQQGYMSPGLQASGRQFTGLQSAAPDRRNPLDRDISYELYGLGRNAPANNPQAVRPIFEATADIADYGRPGSRYNNLQSRQPMTVMQRAADLGRRAELGLAQPAQASTPPPVMPYYAGPDTFEPLGAGMDDGYDDDGYGGLSAGGLTGAVPPDVADVLNDAEEEAEEEDVSRGRPRGLYAWGGRSENRIPPIDPRDTGASFSKSPLGRLFQRWRDFVPADHLDLDEWNKLYGTGGRPWPESLR